MMKQGSVRYQEALALALQLPPTERIAMIAELAASVAQATSPSSTSLNGEDSELITSEEVAALMDVEPLSPAEIIDLGLLGTWADLTISDSAAWVNEQKHKRSERRKWQAP